MWITRWLNDNGLESNSQTIIWYHSMQHRPICNTFLAVLSSLPTTTCSVASSVTTAATHRRCLASNQINNCILRNNAGYNCLNYVKTLVKGSINWLTDYLNTQSKTDNHLYEWAPSLMKALPRTYNYDELELLSAKLMYGIWFVASNLTSVISKPPFHLHCINSIISFK